MYPKPASEPPSPSQSRSSTPAVSDVEDDEHRYAVCFLYVHNLRWTIESLVRQPYSSALRYGTGMQFAISEVSLNIEI